MVVFGIKIQQNSHLYATTKKMYSIKKDIHVTKKYMYTTKIYMYAMIVYTWTTKHFLVRQKYMCGNIFNDIYVLMQ